MNAAPTPEEYEPDPNLLPAPLEYLDFEVLPVEKPRPILKDLLDGASRMIFGGAAKTYKSWGMCDLALSLAGEVPWLDFDAYFSPALYVNFELKDYYFQQRLKAIRAAKRVDLERDALLVWNLRGFQIKFTQFIDDLSRWIENTKRQTVFIDPFYKLLGDKDERVSADLNPILAAFDQINRRTGATIVASAHFAKGNQTHREPAERISGGGSLNRDPDTLLTFTSHENKGEFVLDFTLRDHAPLEPFTVKWVYPLLIRSDSDPNKLKKPRGAGRPGFDPDDLWEIVRDNDDQFATEELIAKAIAELAWARRTVLNKLAELKKAKRIFLSKVSQKWNVKKPRSA